MDSYLFYGRAKSIEIYFFMTGINTLKSTKYPMPKYFHVNNPKKRGPLRSMWQIFMWSRNSEGLGWRFGGRQNEFKKVFRASSLNFCSILWRPSHHSIFSCIGERQDTDKIPALQSHQSWGSRDARRAYLYTLKNVAS